MTTLQPAVDLTKALRIISRAWGRQSGYAFFPHIDREEQIRTGERRSGFHESRAFKWPQEKAKILEHMAQHIGHDLYWCPNLFEGPDRKSELAMDEHALWADLDEADPRLLSDNTDFKPTVAWESSPGRYQGLWLGNPDNGDFQGASWPGNENQRLSYHIGADKSGWDTTQLLRIPGWPNWKPEYRRGDKPRIGKLLWERGPLYEIDDFKSLPEVRGALTQDKLGDILEAEIDNIDRSKVIARIKLKLNQTARDLLSARTASGPQGSRGDNLWYLIRCLADAGCTVQEIVAVVRSSVWNKFEGRHDELKRLITEAMKAIDRRDPEIVEAIEEEQAPKPRPQRLAAFLKDVEPPTWLVDGIATEGSVGFIGGAPKSFKSWFALDLAMSVATGSLFLDYFRVIKPGRVLYIQEEDSAITVKSRSKKIWKSKSTDKMVLENGQVYWLPGSEGDFDPNIDIYCMEGFTASEGHWQEWLDQTMTEAAEENDPYVLILIDTLMNTAGDVEENKSQQMTTKIYKPMKVLMRKHKCALRFIHHMGKGNEERRGGQRMLGGTANHAWSEDSLYITRQERKPGTVKVEFESKSAPEQTYTISGLDNHLWTPIFDPIAKKPESMPSTPGRTKRRPTEATGGGVHPIVALIAQGGSWSTQDIAVEVQRPYNSVYKTLTRLAAGGSIIRSGKVWQPTA
jgi:hypothetical protein